MSGRANDNNWACNALQKAIKSGASPEQAAQAIARTPQFIAAVAEGMSIDNPPPNVAGGLQKWEAARDNLAEALSAMGDGR